MLRTRPQKLTEGGLRGILDTILVRLEDDRESLRYVTNTLVFLGLLGTFWGLILTIGGFAELIGNLNFNASLSACKGFDFPSNVLSPWKFFLSFF